MGKRFLIRARAHNCVYVKGVVLHWPLQTRHVVHPDVAIYDQSSEAVTHLNTLKIDCITIAVKKKKPKFAFKIIELYSWFH